MDRDHRVVWEFLEVYQRDRAAKRHHDVDHYIAQFPDDADIVRQEYERILGGMSDEQGRPPPPWPIEVGSRTNIGPYEIQDELGRGGFGVVYLAEDSRIRRPVAIKVLQGLGPALHDVVERFRREARIASQLDHPGICRVYEAAVQSDVPYIVMERLEGRSLAAILAEHRMHGDDRGTGDTIGTPHRAAELIERVASALHAAHEAGVIHRDIKPENIIVVPERGPVIVDFGLARDDDDESSTLTRSGDVFGTPAYMSPEQIAGYPAHVDRRTDVYSLGVMLYECLTFRRPFEVPTRERLYEAIRTQSPTDPRMVTPAVSRDLSVVTMTALEKNADRRYQSALGFAEDLRRVRAREPIHAKPSPAWTKFGLWAARNRQLSFALATAFLVLIAGLAATLIQKSRADRNDDAAQSGAYRSGIAAAAALIETDPIGALRHLRNAPEDRRGWEWRHVHARLLSQNTLLQHAVPSTGDVAFSSNERDLFSVHTDGLLVRWNLETGNHVVMDQADGVRGISDSAPEDRLALGMSDGSVQVLDTRTGQMLGSPIRHEEAVRLLRWDSSANRLVTSDGGSLQVWRPDGPPKTVPIPTDSHQVRDAAISRDGRHVAVILQAKNVFGHRMVQLWQLDTLELQDSYDHLEIPLSVAFDGSDRILVGMWYRNVHVLNRVDLNRAPAIVRGHQGPVHRVATSRAGDVFASVSSDGTIRIRRSSDHAETGVFLINPDEEPQSPLNDSWPTTLMRASLSASGALLGVPGDEGEIRVWDLRTRLPMRLEGHQRYAYFVAMSPDDLLIASVDPYVSKSPDVSDLRFWDALTGEPLGRVTLEGSILGLRFEEDSGSVAVVTNDGSRVKVVDAATLAVREGGDRDLKRLVAGADQAGPSSSYGDWLAWGEARGVPWIVRPGSSAQSILSLELGGPVTKFDAGQEYVLFAAVSPDGEFVAGVSRDGFLRIWSRGSGRLVRELEAHVGSAFAVCFSPDGSRIATGGNDQTVTIWDMNSESDDPVARLRGHEQYVRGLTFSSDGTRIVSASGDGTLMIWDSIPRSERHRQIAQLRQRREEVNPWIDQLLADGTFAEAASQVRCDSTLSAAARSAALRELISRRGK
ncbi:MAG: protein kinase [bacterium]|nr:protein kinase [bacterium]